MALYIWRQPDDPEADNQKAFVDTYIREKFGPTSEDWKEGVSEALCAYWKAEGYSYDLEEGAFLYPDEQGNPCTFVSDEDGVWLVPFPIGEQKKTPDEVHVYLHRMKNTMKAAGVKPCIVKD
ncbi:hypothetical protein ACFSL6_11790 [Paenibacillus thailandensis]|uniref:Uncharacterized protein n=1 Tax=Paenibacillus thailandensis TaxID=393250 RepID=A0ABW5QZX6_9BACL